jgi:hypothetical protein
MPPSIQPMAPLALSAYTLVTANGRGVGPVLEALRERRSGLKACDFEDVTLKTSIGRVAGLEDFSLDHELRPSIAATTGWPGSAFSRTVSWWRRRRRNSAMEPIVSPS